MRRYTTEFIGTFFLVLTIVTAVSSGSSLAPLAIGGVLAAMIFAGGHISGAHFNPAVTLAVWLRGKVATIDVPGYLAAQFLGAAAAGGVARFLVGAPSGAALSFSGREIATAIVAEVLVTAALAYVVLNVATSSDHEGNSFYGLAIGLTVLAGAVAVGPVSGGVFNPAVAVGVSEAGLISWSALWIYMVTGVLGGSVAAGVFRFTNAHEWAATPAAGTAQVPTPRGPAASETGAARTRSTSST